MKITIESLFGPLDQSYCNYFYYLEIIFFAVFVFMTGVSIKTMLTKNKYDTMQLFLVVLQPLTIYFINRLNYSMCIGSLKK
jgi:hypothetical protein